MNKVIILGAGGHAAEVLDILHENKNHSISFLNNTVKNNYTLFERYPVICNNDSLKNYSSFYLGVGNIEVRKLLSKIALNSDLTWKGVRGRWTKISTISVEINDRTDIMDEVSISPNVVVGEATLINRGVHIHHDCRIGAFCEISPGARILGRVVVEDNVYIGSNAVILPNIKIGEGAIIGAGTVVTQNIASNTTMVGNPARRINKVK